MRRLKPSRFYERRATNRWREEKAPPAFHDWFPDIPGTIPEKILFNLLSDLGVNFYFSEYFGDIPFTPDKKERYRPDFLLPDYHIIIDVQGVYWHSLPGKYESDYLKASLYTAAGWKIYQISDVEIMDHPREVLEAIPELHNPALKGTFRFIGAKQFDPLEPIRARIRRRPKVVKEDWRAFGKRGALKLKPIQAAQPRPKREFKKGPLFTFEDFSEEYRKELEGYTEGWLAYMEQLGSFFMRYPESGPYYYPELYKYWLLWKGWWKRFDVQRP